MIVKVQVPLFSTEEHPKALVYNKTRDFEQEIELSADVIECMLSWVMYLCSSPKWRTQDGEDHDQPTQPTLLRRWQRTGRPPRRGEQQ